MIGQVWELWVCPDPECDEVELGLQGETTHGLCGNYDVHVHGDYPLLERIYVKRWEPLNAFGRKP